MKKNFPLFSIVTVCLNPGKSLHKTIESILSQDYVDFELIIKDGCSSDGTEFFSSDDQRVRFVSTIDRSIYHAMNQAIDLCNGKYIIFLNAGDSFFSRDVLSSIQSHCASDKSPEVLYVDRYNEKYCTNNIYPDRLTAFYLYRRPVCHQATYIRRDIILKHGKFDLSYKILADYDLLVKTIVGHNASHRHYPIVGVSYEDDGISSQVSTAKLKKEEIAKIREKYFSFSQRTIFWTIWQMTLPWLRIWLLNNCKIPLFRKSYSMLANSTLAIGKNEK